MMIKISKAHKKFANYLNDQRALEHPENFLRYNWKSVLNFWLFLDTLSPEQWETIEKRYLKLDYAARAARDTRAAAWDAARAAAWDADQESARAAAWAAAYGATYQDAAAWATYEIIGSHNILNQNKSLTFLPMFLDL